MQGFIDHPTVFNLTGTSRLRTCNWKAIFCVLILLNTVLYRTRQSLPKYEWVFLSLLIRTKYIATNKTRHNYLLTCWWCPSTNYYNKPRIVTPICFYTPATKSGGGGYIGFNLSVCLLTFRVRPVASTVQDGFFPYFVQMINIMRGCVACDDPWPWPISSRSFDLDFENCVRSVTFSVAFPSIFGTNHH